MASSCIRLGWLSCAGLRTVGNGVGAVKKIKRCNFTTALLQDLFMICMDDYDKLYSDEVISNFKENCSKHNYDKKLDLYSFPCSLETTQSRHTHSTLWASTIYKRKYFGGIREIRAH